MGSSDQTGRKAERYDEWNVDTARLPTLQLGTKIVIMLNLYA